MIPATAPHLDRHTIVRSTEMTTMHEALARERMREHLRRSAAHAQARELAAQRRWHRVSAYARRVERRHASRLS
ncbi:hypothetical protein [Jatrophihabitans fulvus]